MRPASYATIVLLATAAATGAAVRTQGPRLNSGAPVEGTIQETRVVDGIVYATVSVGSDDGIARGTRLRVFGGRTGREFLGTVEVTNVEPEECVGRVAGPRAVEVRKDDRVRSGQRRRGRSRERRDMVRAAVPSGFTATQLRSGHAEGSAAEAAPTW